MKDTIRPDMLRTTLVVEEKQFFALKAKLASQGKMMSKWIREKIEEELAH